MPSPTFHSPTSSGARFAGKILQDFLRASLLQLAPLPPPRLSGCSAPAPPASTASWSENPYSIWDPASLGTLSRKDRFSSRMVSTLSAQNAVSKYGAQFQGHAQHDALEFLLWLLDRVHEDSEGSSRGPGSQQLQPEGSKTSENHLSPSAQLSPGQSFVQSHFQAQYRSSLTCPHCLKQSNTFDPFLCVSLPIPLRQTRFLSVTLVFPSQSQRFLRVGLAVPILSTVAALRKMVAQEGNVPVDEVILVELCPSGLQRSFFDEDDLNMIAEGDNVYAFQAPPPPGQETLAAPPPGMSVSPRLAARAGQRLSLPAHRENKVLILCCNLVGSGQQASRFGPPFLIREDRTISWVQLQQSILSKVRHLMKGEAPGQQNPGPLFSIRVVGQSLALSYLSPQDSRPLCHWAVDRALHPRRPGGPPHIKLAVEWDSCAKERRSRCRRRTALWRQQQAHQQHSCTLDECFQFYTKEEQLAQDDAWKCPHCQALQQGVVKLSLWTLPDILIVHLKRFCQVAGRRNKLSTLVKFPLCGLNMAPHVAQRSAGAVPAPGPWPSWKQPACLPTSYPLDFLYDLYAVCNHHGSLQGGHYTAYCRNSLDGQWYSYDDSMVEALPEEEVITRGAYILFYQKRNIIPCWSASSSMRGSTSSSLSDHWLLRLGSNPSSTRGSLSSWRSAPSPAQPPVPDPLVLTSRLSSQEKGGLESRPLVRGERGRSISMKVPTPSRARQGAFRTMPLRWSFGHREKPVVASVELVEYLESRRRPRSTSQSIVPLLTGAAGGDEKSAVPRSDATPSAKGEGSEQRASERVPASVSCPEGRPGASDGLDGLNTAGKLEGRAGHDIRLPKQFDVLLTVTPAVHSEKRARPEGPRTANGKGSGHMGTQDASSTVGRSAPQNAFARARARANAEGRDPETDRLSQGTLTLLRSVFLKKNKKNDRAEVAPQVSPVSLGSGRLSPAVGEQTRVSSSPLRVPGGLARGPEGAVRSAPSSLHLLRKACRPPRASAPSTAQRSAPGEHTPFGSLQRVKYHTLSLRRKRTLPESSF
ncbi:hypothetical protein QTO34_009645 [Cnephaeus nilssonii]|uniref:ubiquitinyl hydrolase 1 n=1 Tax=Cnephaeus nilssonii TaxID=3371016 RepID=A0AA40HI61_CNENI|nr:hypothetical protein QTO34_009645 [Eptesicus nilssonii]